jgi:hypothetical protein
MLKWLTRRLKLLPPSITIRGEIRLKSKYPLGAGGNADVFQGEYNGKLVAMKVFRVSMSSLPGKVFDVSEDKDRA